MDFYYIKLSFLYGTNVDLNIISNGFGIGYRYIL